ncbi:MAG: hypothetical protein EOO63_13900 [Hymenobacter sp.]|nr:MAG: hypothetical protein EOO63_13900 [Hymenobacter sp.]
MICLRAVCGLLVAGLALLASGCKDILQPSLPAATQEGKDTFGCLLDGKTWLPTRKHTLDDILEGHVAGNKLFGLKAEDNYTPANFYLSIADSTGIKPGTYPLRAGFEGSYDVVQGGSTAWYLSGAANQGRLTITKFEPFARTGPSGAIVKGAIVSGTFEFTASSSGSQTITVREGRFDVNAYQ